MYSDREEEISIFNKALEIESTEARSRYLDQACAGYPERRARIDALLAAYGSSPGFLETNHPLPAHILPRTASEKSGMMIGRYKLLEKIGEGGFGTVYMAEQREPVKRRVALKIIKLGMDTKQVVARFEAERQALALMDHPHIAKVLDGGATEAGRPFFVMELVRGTPVTQFCDEYQLTTQARLTLFVQICQALHHAHQKGIIHRDIKPTNILVSMCDDRPVPKVIDFGIAKATQQELTEKTLFTEFHQFIGTPAYMSPEQAQFSHVDIDTRSDIYALGVLLYELLTGRTPIESRELMNAGYDEMCRRIREQEPPLPSTRLSTMADAERGVIAKKRQSNPSRLRTLLRGDLDWIVMKALEKDRTRRYESANNFAQDVRRFLSSEPVEAAPPSPWYRFQRFTRRHTASIAVAATIALLLVTGTTVSAWLAIRASRAQAASELEADRARQAGVAEAQQRSRAQTNESIAIRHLVEARHEQGAAMLASAYRLIEQKRFFEARMTAARALGFAGFGRPEGDPNFATHYPQLLKPDSSEEQEARLLIDREQGFTPLWRSSVARHHPNPLGNDFFSPGHTVPWQIAFSANGSNLLTKLVVGIRSWHLGDGRLLREWNEASHAAVSPQGDFIISNDDHHFSLIDPSSGLVLRTLKASGSAIRGIAVDRAGKYIALELAGKEIQLFDRTTGALISTITGLESPASAMALDPSGRWVAYARPDFTVQICDATTGNPVQRLEGHGKKVRSLEFSPAQALLASAGDDQTIRLWSTDNWQSESILSGHTQAVHSLAFHPTGSVLLSGSADHSVRSWNMTSRQLMRTLEGHDSSVMALAFDSDGSRFASGCQNGVIRVWDAQTFQSRSIGETHSDGVSSVRISPDGRLIASGSYDRTVRIWAAHTGALVATLRGHSASVQCVDFSPDGSQLASVDARAVVMIWDVERWEKRLTLIPGEPLRDPYIWYRGAILRYSPDGQFLASRNGPNPIVWETASGKRMAELDPMPYTILALAWDPSGSILAASDVAGAIGLWRFPDPKPFLKLQSETVHRGITFDPDGSHFGRTARNGYEFLDAQTGKLSFTFGNTSSLDSAEIAISPDRSLLISAGNGIQAWDLRTRTQICELTGHQRQVTSVDLAPDNSFLASGSLDGTVALWDLAVNRSKAETIFDAPGVAHVEFDSSGSNLVVVGTQGPIIVHNVQTGEEVARHEGLVPLGPKLWNTAAGVETVYVGTSDGDIQQWNPITGVNLHKMPATNSTLLALAVHRGNRLLAAAYSNRTIQTWDTSNWVPRQTWNIGITTDRLEFSPDGTRLAVTSRSKHFELWNPNTATLEQRLEIPQGSISGAVFYPNGLGLVTAGNQLRIWNLTNAQVAFTTTAAHDVHYAGPAVSADGTFLAVARAHSVNQMGVRFILTIEIRELPSGRLLAELPLGSTMESSPRIALSSDGKHLAVGWFGINGGIDPAFRLYDLSTIRREKHDLAAFTPDFRWTRNPPAFELPIVSSNLYGVTPSLKMQPGSPLGALRLYQDADPDRLTKLFWRTWKARNWSDAAVILSQLKGAQRDLRGQKALTQKLLSEAQRARGNGLLALARRHADLAVSVSPDDPGTWSMVAALALMDGRLDHAGDAVRQLLRLQPDAAQSWQLHGQVLMARKELEQALQAFNQAVERAGGSQSSDGRAALKSRAAVLHQLGRLDEARGDQLLGLGLPPREPGLSERQLDLTLFYNGALDGDLIELRGNHFKEFLAVRTNSFGNVQFDARGIIQLHASQPAARGFPKAVNGIPVRQNFGRIHVLHATAFDLGLGAIENRRIGEYVLHYADGSHQILPVEYGTHIHLFGFHPAYPDQVDAVKKAGLAWDGRNDYYASTPVRIALFKATWDNPHPDKRVESIDLVTSHPNAAPFIAGITVE